MRISKDSWLNESYREWASSNGESVPAGDFQVNFCEAFWKAMEINPGVTEGQFWVILAWILAAIIFSAGFAIYGGGHATLEYGRKAADLFGGILDDPVGIAANIMQVVFPLAMLIFLITVILYTVDSPKRKHGFALVAVAAVFLNAVMALHIFLLDGWHVFFHGGRVGMMLPSQFMVVILTITTDFTLVMYLVTYLLLFLLMAIISLAQLLLQKGFVKAAFAYAWSRVKNIKLCPMITLEG